MFKHREIDMLNGSLWDKIILFAMPLALTGVMQQLLNAADVVVLGQFVGKNAMAAVGNNTALIGLLVNLFMGLSLGANVVIAQNLGAKKIARAHAAVQTAFFLALTTGVIIAAIGEVLVDPIFELLSVPQEVLPMAESYLRIYLQRHDWSRGQMNAVKGPTLNKQSIGRAVIPLPPIELQEKMSSH